MLAPAANATTLFLETFDTAAADTTAFNAAYPTFSTTAPAGKAVTASGGQAVITASDNSNFLAFAQVPGFAGEVTYSVEAGASNSGGNYNVGMIIGSTLVAFHPGFAGGALRVVGPGGFGNQNVGFTPANGVLHKLEVTQNFGGTVGLFQLRLTDGNNPGNVYTNSWTDAALVNAPFGIYRDGPAAPETGFYDNLMATAIPEPGAASLLGLSLLGLISRRRRKV